MSGIVHGSLQPLSQLALGESGSKDHQQVITGGERDIRKDKGLTDCATHLLTAPNNLLTYRSLLEVAELSVDALLEWAKPALELPAIEQLAIALEPVLGQLREQHRSTSDQCYKSTSGCAF